MSALKIIGVVFGCFFFAAHLLSASTGVRAGKDRDARLQAFGAIVPGFAGVLIVVALLSPWWPAKIISSLAVVPLIVFGRAFYELLVFRKRRPRA
jgi:hypothetical protein